MTFSQRVPANVAENQISRLLAEMRASNSALIDLTIANPTQAGISYPVTLLHPLSDPRSLVYEPAALGIADARLAIAEDFARREVTVDPQRLALTVSTSEAYSVLFKLLCNPGEEVLIPEPSYPLFEHLTKLDGVSVRPYRVEYHGRWRIDLASVAGGFSERTRALLLVSPNNPTGSFVSAEELRELAALCAPRGTAIIADEVFVDYALDNEAWRQRGVLERQNDVLGFTLGGLSKSGGLPQLKLAWTAVSGPASLVSEAMMRLEFICDSYLSVATPIQVGLRRVLEGAATVREQIQARVRRNHGQCIALVQGCPACSLLHVEGGWSAVIRVPRLMSEEALVLSLLADSGVLVHPGYFFDFEDEAHIVVSLLARERAFTDGLERVLRRFRDSV